MIGAIPNNALGFDDDVLYERRLVESQRKTVFRGKEVDRVLSEAAKTHVDRVRLAKRSHVPQNRRKYGLTKSHESDLAEAIGGKTSKDQNEPFDIYTDQHAIEVKTIVESGYDRITMHPKSLKVKKAIAESLGLKPHTVVFDTRKGREAVYYREGLGSFRLNQMKKVPSLEAVREALEFGVKGMKWGVRKGKDNSSKVALDFPDKISENSFYHVAPIGSVRGILSKGLGKSDKSYVSDNLSEIEHFATEWTAGEKGSYALVELDKSKIPSQINKTLKVDKAAVSVWGAETRARSFNGTIPPSAIKKITIVKVRDVGTEEDPELEHWVRKIIKLDKSSKESLREFGVKGMKWGVRGPRSRGLDKVDWSRWKRPRLSSWEKKQYKTTVAVVPVSKLQPMTPKSLLGESDYRLIDRYANKMKSGARFPLIEVEKTRSGKYFVSDGNMRLRAWRKLGYKEVPVLIVKALEVATKEGGPGSGPQGGRKWGQKSKQDSFDLISDLYKVGTKKPVGYLPISTLKKSGYVPEEIKTFAEKRGLKVFQSPPGFIEGGGLYVYSKVALGKFLLRNSEQLEEIGLSTSPDAFIKQISTKWYSEAAELLNRAFGKGKPSIRESIREHGVKGQKWGVRRKRDEKKGAGRSLAKPFEGRMKVTVLMGINGSGKSTLLKNLVQRYGEDETDVDGNKWNVISRKGKRAALMGNYSGDEHINAGRYFIRGNFWGLLGKGVKDLKREGVQNIIVDAKRLAFGKQHDNMVKFAKQAGIDLEFVRVKTPPDVAAERIGKRREKGHRTYYPPEHLKWQDQQVGEHFSKRSESPRLTLKNDRHTNLRREAKKLAKFALRESGGNVNESYSSGISVPREAEVFA